MIRSALIVAAVAGSASADYIDMRFVGTTEGRSVRVAHTPTGYAEDVFAGGLNHEVSATGEFAFLDGDHLTYCVDVHERVTREFQPFEMSGFALRGDQRSMISAIMVASEAIQGQAADRDRYAATQLLVWEAVYDSGINGPDFDFASGDFTATRRNGRALWNSLLTASNLILQNLDPASAPALLIAMNDGAQDQAIIPAPATLSVAGLGLLAARRRR